MILTVIHTEHGLLDKYKSDFKIDGMMRKT